jgi:hypothetical protein
LLLAALQNLSAPNQQSRIDPERPTDKTEDDDCADTEPATRKTNATTAAAKSSPTAIIFDVLAPTEIIPAHDALPCRSGIEATQMIGTSNPTY